MIIFKFVPPLTVIADPDVASDSDAASFIVVLLEAIA